MAASPPDLFANSPIPGTDAPIATLNGSISTTPAAGTVETWTISAPAPAALQVSPGQFRVIVDREILLVDSSTASGTAWSVTRGIEGSVITGHVDGASVFHLPTAAALDTRYARLNSAQTLRDDQVPSAVASASWLQPSGGDDTAEINAAVAAGQELGVGTFQISGQIDCPLGQGPNKTIIQCTSGSAKIQIGSNPGVQMPQIHDTRGNFRIDGRTGGAGANVGGAGSALLIVNTEGTLFLPIDVHYSAGDGVWWLGQNCTFQSIESAGATDDGWVQDQGAGGGLVENYEFSNNGGVQWRSKQTPGWTTIGYGVPTNNVFMVGRMEQQFGGGQGCIQQDAGVGNYFVHPELTQSAIAPIVRLTPNADGFQNGSLILLDGNFNGPGAAQNTPAIRTDPGLMNASQGVILQGANTFGGVAYVWSAINTQAISYDDGRTVTYNGGYIAPTATTAGAIFRQSDGSGWKRAVRQNNPLGWWRFGEASGSTLLDEQSVGIGAYHGSYVLGKAGAIRGDVDPCVLLSGGYATVADQSYLRIDQPLTIEAWANVADHAAFYVLVAKYTGGWQWYLNLTDGKQVFQGQNATVNSSTGVPLNQWNHLAVTYDGTNFRFYLNGVSDGAPAATGSIGVSTDTIGLGARGDGSFPLAGRLDEVALYNTVLSADQIAVHYQAAQ